MPLVHAEVGVEAVREGEPRHLPAHPRLQPRDVRLRRTRDENEGGVAGVQVGDVGDLVGHHGAAPAGVVGPAEHARLEEGAVDDQLTPTVEQVEQAGLARRPLERIRRLHGHPRHSPALGGQGVTGAGLGLFLHEQLLRVPPPTPAATRPVVRAWQAVRLSVRSRLMQSWLLKPPDLGEFPRLVAERAIPFAAHRSLLVVR